MNRCAARGQPGVGVAAADRARRALEALGRDGVLGMRDQRRQRLVVDLDRLRALPGRLQRLAEHPADGVPVEHHLGGEQRLVVLLAGVVDARARRRRSAPGPRRAPGRRARRRSPVTSGVRVRRLHRPGVQQSLVRPTRSSVYSALPVTCSVGALVRDLQPDLRVVRPVGQRSVCLAHRRPASCELWH